MGEEKLLKPFYFLSTYCVPAPMQVYTPEAYIVCGLRGLP